jgi:hypothetical protein
LFGYPKNESSVYSASIQCFEKLEEFEKIIKLKVAGQDVAHTDEKGVMIKRKLH